MEPRTKLSVILLVAAIAAAWAMQGDAVQPVTKAEKQVGYTKATLIAADQLPVVGIEIWTVALHDGTVCQVSIQGGGTSNQSHALSCHAR